MLRSSTIAVTALLLISAAFGSAPQQQNLPMTCSELMPENGPYVSFFESVGRGNALSNKAVALNVFMVLAYREKLASIMGRGSSDNPIDGLIRKALCIYRIETEPLKLVTFDDPKFIEAFKPIGKELEKKVAQVVQDAEVDRLRRQAYEKRLEKNSSLVEKLRREAEVSADRQFERIARAAKKEAKR